MTMYHPIKCSCKKISSSADMVQSHTWLRQPSLWPWTWRRHTNHLAWPWWCITVVSLVTEGTAVEEISSRWTFPGILNLFCDLDLDHNRAIQSFHKTIQLMMMCHQPAAKGSVAKKTQKEVILWLYDLSLWPWPTLKAANQSFWNTIRLIMMHHNTKFSNKMSGGVQ